MTNTSAARLRALIGAMLCVLIGGPPIAHAATAAAAPAPLSTDIGPVEIVKRDSGLPPAWERHGVFVEIFVRAYQDSNGDGVGDLNGVTQRLDYLRDLGVTGIWLMPIFRSEDHDHGYAVANYREIEPAYGTLADLDRLLAEAHKRGIGVIVDYVMNHSSSSHPVFEDAYDHRQSAYADWYIFKTEPQKGWNSFDGDPWREAGPRWYYGAFTADMPDFNLRNPAVVDFHLDNLKFWLNRGVDGFRFDAVGVLIENGSIGWENQPENHVLMERVQDLLAQYGQRTMVCEAPSDPAAFAQASSCGSAFAFGLQKHILRSVRMGRLMPDVPYMLRTMPIDHMGTFLANHDTFAGTRLFQQLQGDEASYRIAAASLLTLPGRPFIYYGEEIGLAQSPVASGGDPALRGPMSWSAEHNAGFTTAEKPFRPNVDNWRTHNVAVEQANPASLLNWYKALITLRKAKPALADGSFTNLSKDDDPIFAFVREREGQRILVAINYASRDATLSLPADFNAESWTPVFPQGGKWVVGPPKARKPAKGDKSPPATGLELRLGAQQVVIVEQATGKP